MRCCCGLIKRLHTLYGLMEYFGKTLHWLIHLLLFIKPILYSEVLATAKFRQPWLPLSISLCFVLVNHEFLQAERYLQPVAQASLVLVFLQPLWPSLGALSG